MKIILNLLYCTFPLLLTSKWWKGKLIRGNWNLWPLRWLKLKTYLWKPSCQSHFCKIKAHWWELRSNYFSCVSLRTTLRFCYISFCNKWLSESVSSPSWELSLSPRAPLALGTGSTLCLPCVGPLALLCNSTCRHMTMKMIVIRAIFP